jgi:hypothetical protein
VPSAEFEPHLITGKSRKDRRPESHAQRHLTGTNQGTGGN